MLRKSSQDSQPTSIHKKKTVSMTWATCPRAPRSPRSSSPSSPNATNGGRWASRPTWSSRSGSASSPTPWPLPPPPTGWSTTPSSWSLTSPATAPMQPNSGASAGGEPAKLIDAIPAKMLDAGHPPDGHLSTGPPFAYSHPSHRVHSFLPLGTRQYFFDRAARRPRMSSSLSATSCFSRRFSCSRALSRLASETSRPPCLDFHR